MLSLLFYQWKLYLFHYASILNEMILKMFLAIISFFCLFNGKLGNMVDFIHCCRNNFRTSYGLTTSMLGHEVQWTQVNKLTDRLIDYLLFNLPIRISSLILGLNCHWRSAKIKAYARLFDPWGVRRLYRAIPALIQYVGLIRRTAPFVRHVSDTARHWFHLSSEGSLACHPNGTTSVLKAPPRTLDIHTCCNRLAVELSLPVLNP